MRVPIAGLSITLAAVTAMVGCGAHVAHNLPPASRLMQPGPGVGGPGPGVIQPASYSAAMAGAGGFDGGPGCMGGPGGFGATSQIAFRGVNGMEVAWDVGGDGLFDAEPLVTPGSQNFYQGAIYRLKLTNIPGRPGVELYPTIEVAPVTPRTDEFLAHSRVPAQFTEEDFDQVLSGNFVTKVIYLPDPEFQELALAGVETLVSTRLDPGVDPIDEADRRGSILAIIRMGGKDLELPSDLTSGGQVMPAQYANGDQYAPTPLETGPYPPSNGLPAFEDGLYPPSNGGTIYENGPYSTPAPAPSGGAMGMPMGMPTAGMQPVAVPPGVVSGVGGPQWGMPFVGTPIGLPGPAHIPLGSPAGLTRHVIKNRTRVHMPPPVDTMHVSVKQRPGMGYPQPVRHVRISEVQRAPFRLFGLGRLFASPIGNGPPGAPSAYDQRQSRRAARVGSYETCE